jgi:TPR repeat protein
MTRRWTTFFAAAVLVVATAGVGTAQQESIDELRAKAEQGDAEAQFDLGGMYKVGNGVPQNYAEARRLYRLAAEQGHARAQNALGLMYSIGRGVLQDDAEAVRWYRLAADQWLDVAQSNLGSMYRTGRGVPQDMVLAHMWKNLAAAAAADSMSEVMLEIYVTVRDEIANDLTPDQRAEAQRLAREWDEAHPRD